MESPPHYTQASLFHWFGADSFAFWQDAAPSDGVASFAFGMDATLATGWLRATPSLRWAKKKSQLAGYIFSPADTGIQISHFQNQLTQQTTMKILFPFFALLLVVVASSFTRPAVTPKAPTAAVDFFLKLEGIQGETKDKAHKGWIDLNSYSLDRAGQTIQVSCNNTPRSSAKIALFCAQGTHIKKAVLHVRKSGGDYMKIELENVLITSYQTSSSSSSSGVPTDTFSLNFTKISFPN